MHQQKQKTLDGGLACFMAMQQNGLGDPFLLFHMGKTQVKPLIN